MNPSFESIERSRYQWFVKVWAVFGCVLFAVTWKLWTPQTEFPQIPYFESLVSTPGWVDWIALAITGCGLLGCVLAKWLGNSGSSAKFEYPQIACLIFAAGLATLILFNQHRLQPWAYQFLIFAIVIGLAKPKQALASMRWIVLSIYIFSALSKFDYQFIHTVGDQMLSTLTGFVGVETGQWSVGLRSSLILLFPAGELLVGIGLAIPKTRRMAVLSAVGLHVTLLMILGPLGMNHQPGVLVWNLFFVFQSILLFGSRAALTPKTPKPEPKARSNRSNPWVTAVTWLVVCFPTTQWMGICDHWPAWQVYSPSSSRAKLVNERSLASWSIEELGVPVYPQGRFQLAVAIAIAKKQNLNRAQIELGDQSDRFTGKRTTETISGEDQFQMKTQSYWLNTQARKLWFD